MDQSILMVVEPRCGDGHSTAAGRLKPGSDNVPAISVIIDTIPSGCALTSMHGSPGAYFGEG